MYQSDQFLVVAQPSDKLLMTEVFILPLCHSFDESTHVIYFEVLDNLRTSNKLKRQHSLPCR